jgi:very-short-patch-repair endonuclease
MPARIPRPIMLRLARGQRSEMVRAEAILWRALRARRSEDLKFRRQVPIGDFIADFVCFEKRIIIEVDGPTHDGVDRQAADKARDYWLSKQGFRIIRIGNELVIGSPEIAVQTIFTQINAG